MKQIFTLLIGVFLFSQFLTAQQNQYLIAIDLQQTTDANRLERLDLPVFHLADETLVTVVEQSMLEKLRQEETIQVLDVDFDLNRYWLIEKKKKNLTEIPIPAEVLYRFSDQVIIKHSSPDIGELTKAGYGVVELTATVNTFRNEKITQPGSVTTDIDSVITTVLDDIKADSVQYFIHSLQDFGTRFLLADNRREVSVWIRDEFIRMGYANAHLDSFQYQGGWQYNVIAMLSSAYGSDEYIVFGGHHDSYSNSNPTVYAPGSDDNASGTAAVMETARVLKLNNYQSDANIVFVTYAAEEYGLWGSKNHAQKLYDAGTNVKLMINHDMISHTYSSVSQSSVDVNPYSGSESYRDLAMLMVNTYTPLNASQGGFNSSGSDSRSYYNLGYNAVYFEEDDFSPYYHSDADTIGNYSMPFTAEVISASCATLLSADAIPGTVKDMEVVDYGTGTELLIRWDQLTAPDVDFYRVEIGTAPGSYTTSTDVNGDSLILGGLTEGTVYYVGITVYDDNGNVGFTVEKTGTPMSNPLVPNGFSTDPNLDGVVMTWEANHEYDLAGYNVYRIENLGDTPDKLNANTLTDTTYQDESGLNGVYYYYQVVAVDDQGNESPNSEWMRSRVVSLDQGILIVDETRDGDGSLGNPTDAEVDDYYEMLLENFDHQNYDLIEEEGIGLADIGAFSAILWHGDDTQDQSAPFQLIDDLVRYLDYGGKIFYVGYRPTKAFADNNSFSATYSTGEFIYDYLKIGASQNSFISRFNEAEGDMYAYPDIWVDSSKTFPAFDYHLRNVELLYANSEGEEIFLFQSNSATGGGFTGEPVGIEYNGADYKSVVVSFPLYYMNADQAKRLMEYVMSIRFSEPVGVEDEETGLPEEYTLRQNYPNPFNPSTVISFSLPASAEVSLKIYDVLGREVADLISGNMVAGYHKVEFDAGGITSGIYFYTLRTAAFTSTKKMLLLK